MRDIIKDLRSALELQQAIQGSLVPLGNAAPPAEDIIVDIGEDVTENITDAAPAHPEVTSTPSPTPLTTAPAQVNITPKAPQTPYDNIAGLIPADSPLHAMQSLEEVSHYVANTVLIPLDQTRLNPVFGVGNPTSDLLVIGEAPGADEDQQGEPFVGKAGQLLNKILAAINFQRQDIYIANILKSRPPNNRAPQPAEVQAHIPILYKQISLIQPKIILCVGRTSGTGLLNRPEASLRSMRGRFNDFHGIPVMVTYHPAALLRNPGWKRPTWEDVQLLRQKYDELVG